MGEVRVLLKHSFVLNLTDNRMQRVGVDKKLKRIFDAVSSVTVILSFSGVSRVKVANLGGGCSWLKFTTSLSALVKLHRG